MYGPHFVESQSLAKNQKFTHLLPLHLSESEGELIDMAFWKVCQSATMTKVVLVVVLDREAEMVENQSFSPIEIGAVEIPTVEG